ncbi:MAG: hypothetical protein AAFO91_00605 [Bacteroidota bacterium]
MTLYNKCGEGYETDFLAFTRDTKCGDIGFLVNLMILTCMRYIRSLLKAPITQKWFEPYVSRAEELLKTTCSGYTMFYHLTNMELMWNITVYLENVVRSRQRTDLNTGDGMPNLVFTMGIAGAMYMKEAIEIGTISAPIFYRDLKSIAMELKYWIDNNRRLYMTTVGDDVTTNEEKKETRSAEV